MKIKILLIPIVVFSLLLLNSCNSTPYEIEEVEDYSDSTLITSRNEIKQEVEQPKVEIKTDPLEKKETVIDPVKTEPQFYIVQIGAFEKEENAMAFTNKLKQTLEINVYYKFIDGLYKVRTGELASKDDAVSLLSKLLDSGYEGFIVSGSVK